LRQETEYLRNHDAVARQVNERIDLCLQNKWRFSNGKRKAFLSKGYSADMLAGRADNGEVDDESSA